MTIGRKASRLAVAIKPVPAARNTTVADGTYDGYIRGVSDLPPAIPNNEDRPIIRPIGKTHWKDIPVVRKGRRPSSVLTCLLKSNHPGILDYDGAKVVATEWEQYHAVKDTNGHSIADKIEDAFWLRYKYEDAYSEKAKQHVRRCCKALLPSIFYYARIQAIIDHFRKTEKTNMNDKLAGQYYLDRSQYLVQRQSWLVKEAWIVVVDEWCSEEWIAKSKKHRENRVSSKYKPHKGGSNSMTTISQKMSEKTGEEVNQIQAWVHTHRGTDKNLPLILNTPEATKCLALYTKKAKELNGQDYDTLKNDVSSKALYDCSNGKRHGTWSLFNGIVNDTEVIAEVRATGASSAALKRRRAEETADVLRKETEKTRKAEAYANNVLSWGVGMYEHCNGIQKFLEALATSQGVPIGEIPPPPVPPPARSLSPPGSPQQYVNQILENSEEQPALCAQQQANPSSLHEHDAASNVPAADDEDMFGGFFSQSGNGALTSILSSQSIA